MKTTMDRVREALEEHFGYAHLKTIDNDADLFGDTVVPSTGRALGDALDRVEMLCSLESEFQIEFPYTIETGPISLTELTALVDVLLKQRNGINADL